MVPNRRNLVCEALLLRFPEGSSGPPWHVSLTGCYFLEKEIQAKDSESSANCAAAGLVYFMTGKYDW